MYFVLLAKAIDSEARDICLTYESNKEANNRPQTLSECNYLRFSNTTKWSDPFQMSSHKNPAELLSKQREGVFHEKFSTMSKRGTRFIRHDMRLRVRRALGWTSFPFHRHRLAETRRRRPTKLLLFLASAAVFVGTALHFIVVHSKSVRHDTSNSSLHISSEPKLRTQLQRPPFVNGLLKQSHKDGRARITPDKHLTPFVYTAVGIASQNLYTNSSEILLFLYTQGTVACTGEHATPCSNLNVSSCKVGADLFPVVYSANGVFTCSITRMLRNGEPLTVIVAKEVWKQKLDTVEDQTVEEHLKSMIRLDDGSYIVPSDTVWEGQMDPSVAEDEGRYRVCLMTQEKVFADFVPEWLTYHRRIGIDYVYIYDNNSPKSLAEMYSDAKDVEIIHWPWERSQIQAQNHFLLVGRRRCQWGVLIDVDEFIMMRPGRYKNSTELPLKAMLRDMREKRDVSQVRVKSLVLGSSGYIYRPKGPLGESYWHLASIQDNLTKPIVWLGHVMPDSSVHRVETSPGYYTWLTANYLDIQGEITSIGLCHMKYRSWEDYVEKGRGGRNSFQVGSWDESSNWSIHSPPMNHLDGKNKEMFTEFRRIWRRTLGRPILEPELGRWDEANRRYDRIKRKGWVWKKRRALVTTENTSLSIALIERERAFQRLKDWEIAKQKRLAQWNKEVEFLT